MHRRSREGISEDVIMASLNFVSTGQIPHFSGDLLFFGGDLIRAHSQKKTVLSKIVEVWMSKLFYDGMPVLNYKCFMKVIRNMLQDSKFLVP
jgi:hypothetical protein